MDVVSINVMESFVALEQHAIRTPDAACASPSLLVIPIIFACHQSISHHVAPNVKPMHIVNMEYLKIFAFAMRARWEILMKVAVSKRKMCAHRKHVAQELNAGKD